MGAGEKMIHFFADRGRCFYHHFLDEQGNKKMGRDQCQVWYDDLEIFEA